MRKSAVAIALAMLLVFAATAIAGVARFKGHGGTGDVVVSFKGHGQVDKHGDVKLEQGRVTDFSIANVTQTIDCGAPNPEKKPVGYFFEKPIDINHGVFFDSEKVDKAPDQTARVRGHFESGASAEGWFRLSGTAGPCSVDTGRVEWVAHIK